MSTAAYNTAPRNAAARDDSWLDSWENAGRHRRPHVSDPGYFAPRIYRGRSVEELIPTIVADLGEDAVVIRHHRGLTGGFAGFFQRSFVEIEARRGEAAGGALVDRYNDGEAAPALPGDPAPALDDAHALPSDPAPAFDDARALPAEIADARAPVAPKPLSWDGPTEVWATNPFAAALAEAEAAVRAAEPAVPPDLDAALAEALAEAEDAEAPVDEIVPSPPDLYAEPAAVASPTEAEHTALPAEPAATERVATAPVATAPAATEPVAAAPPAEPLSPSPPAAPLAHAHARDEIEHALRAVGIGEELVHELIEGAIAHLLPLMPASTSLAQAVHTALAQRIPACPPLPAGSAAIAVVGAGGSGKSACCAALLEAYRAHGTLPATCVAVSPDTAPEELALREARAEGGVLLLDTPPVSCADPASIDALAGLLARLAPDRVVLALPATLGATPAAQLLQALRPLNATALAITHADETDQLGVAVQAACTFGPAPVHLLAPAAQDSPSERPETPLHPLARAAQDSPSERPETPLHPLARAGQGNADEAFEAPVPNAPRAWALTWIDPFLLADRLLPPR